jgi:glycerophosphoryl diester phosphodiesterase
MLSVSLRKTGLRQVYEGCGRGNLMLIIGHRGARAVAPENTLSALRKGMECADLVEIDVRVSRDGVLVVMHDATVDRTTNGSGPVAGIPLAELKRLDAGDGERIPTLAEVLDLVGGRSGLVVEIKEPGSERPICRMLAGRGPDEMYIVSFHPEILREVRTLLPRAKTGYIYSKGDPDPVETAVAIRADVLLPRKDRADRMTVGRAHQSGLAVVLWTLNTDEEFEDAVSLGVEGFASDDPCRAREFLRRCRERSVLP